MKTELRMTVVRIAFLMSVFALAVALSGCKTDHMRDIELKGMYVNGYSETVALGYGRLTSIPGDREALAAHYEEDSSWLHPTIKTHKIDIFMVGKSSAANSPKVIEDICKAFADVAPTVSKENAEVAKSVAAVTPLGVVKAGGEVRKAVELAKVAAGKVTTTSGQQQAADGGCADGSCSDGSCSDDSSCSSCQDL